MHLGPMKCGRYSLTHSSTSDGDVTTLKTSITLLCLVVQVPHSSIVGFKGCGHSTPIYNERWYKIRILTLLPRVGVVRMRSLNHTPGPHFAYYIIHTIDRPNVERLFCCKQHGASTQPCPTNLYHSQVTYKSTIYRSGGRYLRLGGGRDSLWLRETIDNRDS